MFDFDIKQLPGGIAIVSVRGMLDESNRTYFFECVKDLINDGFSSVIVDCDGLGHINSSGLAGLVRARSQTESSGGKIFLTHVNATVADVLNLTKLNKLFSIYATTEEVLETLNADSSSPISIEPEA